MDIFHVFFEAPVYVTADVTVTHAQRRSMPLQCPVLLLWCLRQHPRVLCKLVSGWRSLFGGAVAPKPVARNPELSRQEFTALNAALLDLV